MVERLWHGERLSVFRRDGSDGRGKNRVNGQVDRVITNRRTRRVFPEIIVTLPTGRWSNRSRNEAASTVRADVEQDGVDARCAKRAFIAADAGLA